MTKEECAIIDKEWHIEATIEIKTSFFAKLKKKLKKKLTITCLICA